MNTNCWLASATAGTELATRDAINALGAQAWVARRVDCVREGPARNRVPRTEPLLPGYLFVRCSPEQWHEIKATVRTLWPDMTPFSDAYWDNRLAPFMAETDRDAEQRLAAIEAGRRVEKYQAGTTTLLILVGALAGQRATFQGVVEDEDDLEPLKLIAEIGSIGGRALTMRFDAAAVTPLNL